MPNDQQAPPRPHGVRLLALALLRTAWCAVTHHGDTISLDPSPPLHSSRFNDEALALPPHHASAARPGGPIVCADRWRELADETTGKTCGDIIREAVDFDLIDPLMGSARAAAYFPTSCSACAIALNRLQVNEPIWSKVQCLADCLPGGKTFGQSFCQTHRESLARARQQRRLKRAQTLLDLAIKDPVNMSADALSLSTPWPEEGCLSPGDNVPQYFTAALARGPAPVPTMNWPERESLGDIKVVINAAGNRESLPRQMLLQSIADAKFASWDRVVVVLGGSATEEEPHLEPITQVVSDPLDITSANETGGQNGSVPLVVVIRTRMMNFDLHGLAMLGRHSKHPLMRARGYLYLLETTLVEPNFVDALERLDELLVTPTTIVSVTPPNANIALMAADVPAAFGRNFEHLLTKQQGLQPEHGIPALTREGCDTSKTGVQKTVSDADGWGTEPCRDAGNNLLLPVMSFGDVTFVGRRSLLCSNCTVWDNASRTDIYGTGMPRVVMLYKAFALRKFVMWGGSGDLHAAADPTRQFSAPAALAKHAARANISKRQATPESQSRATSDRRA